MTSFEDAVKSGLGDWSVVGLSWPNDEDLAITLVPPGAEGTLEVLFRWVTGVVVDLNFGTYGGRPLVFGAKVERKDNRLSCELVFGGQPEGRIMFEYDTSHLTRK
jgi:hypothetical protein